MHQPWKHLSIKCNFVFVCSLLSNQIILFFFFNIFNREKQGHNGTLLRTVFTNFDIYIRAKDPNLTKDEIKTFKKIIFESAGYNVRTLMIELMQPCNYLLRKCNWMDKEVPCDSLFHISETSEGICCSFNHHGIEMYVLIITFFDERFFFMFISLFQAKEPLWISINR